jgi:hypothetical protein
MKSSPLLDNGKGKPVLTSPPPPTTTPEQRSSVAVPRFSHSHAPSFPNGAAGTDRGNNMLPERVTTTQPQGATTLSGLHPPQLLSKAWVTGESTPRLHMENKRHRRKLQREQKQPT